MKSFISSWYGFCMTFCQTFILPLQGLVYGEKDGAVAEMDGYEIYPRHWAPVSTKYPLYIHTCLTFEYFQLYSMPSYIIQSSHDN